MESMGLGARAGALLGTAVLVFLAGASACEMPPTGPPELVLEARVRPSGDGLDLLLVVSNAYDMASEHSELYALPYELAQTVTAPPEGGPRVTDLHVGVITADVGAGGFEVGGRCLDGDMGALLGEPTGPDCPDPLDPPFLAYGGSAGEVGPELGRDLVCLLDRLGTGGCTYEQPLRALELALGDRVEDGANAGFFRPGATLAVVIVQDDDDCSAAEPSFFDPDRTVGGQLLRGSLRCYYDSDRLEPVERFADLLRAQRPAGRVVVGGWLPVPVDWDGDLSPLRPDPAFDWTQADWEELFGHHLLCETSRGSSSKAPRLAELVLLMGRDGLARSICAGSVTYGVALGRLVLDRLEPEACLASAPPAGSRCEVTLRPLEPADGCPGATRRVGPGACALEPGGWDLVDTGRCTELRASPEVEVPPGAALEIRCFRGPG